MKALHMNPSASRFRARVLALLIAATALAAVSLPAQAQRTFSARYTNTAVNGDIAGIGNVNMNCAPFTAPPAPSAACATSRTHIGGSGDIANNNQRMVFTDVDSDASTFNSSSATLNLPAGSTVLFAGLYWSGQASTATTGRNTVRFAVPGGSYAAITASQFDSLIGGQANHPDYQAFANVTAQVAAAGNGVYTVADIANSRNDIANNNTWAGWSLVVAYSNSGLPLRNLNVFDGWQRVDGPNPILDLSISGFITPPTGPVNSTLGALAWDGDRPANDGSIGLQFGPSTAALSTVSNAINPAANFWNSTISVSGSHVTAGRTPAYTNTLGMDLDFQPPNVPLPNGATSAAIRLQGSANEVIDIGMVSLATDVFAPDLVSSITKTVVDVNGGEVEPGDVLTYTIGFTNSGQDGATNVLVTDPVPAATTFVPGSMFVLTNDTNDGGASNGGATGPMTDASDGDPAEFAGGNVVFRMGSDDATWDGGTGLSNGGIVNAGYAASFRFQVTVNADVAAGTTITNTVGVTHNAQTIPDFDASGSADASVTVADDIDLSIVKTVTPTTAVVGETVTYTLEVGNAGPLAGNNSVVRDPAVPGLDCSAATPVCTATGNAQCPASPTIAGLQGTGLTIPALPVGDTIRIEYACVVTTP